ncbi:MAG: nicotinamide riboside transporter PnuC [Pseudoclavibacter caeni]|jgi:nicotinamide mononucleotide transporter
MSLFDAVRWLYDATIPMGDLRPLVVREVVGNVFGLASALGGMRRRVWAWPVGIIGNALLFTVFVGAIATRGDTPTLLGQAGRQLMFIAVSAWGWWSWRRARREQDAAGAATARAASLVGDAERDDGVQPRWATPRQRAGLVIALLVGTAALTPLFRALGSSEPVWADAWTFMGSLLATWGMARRWVEFWLIWVAVDLVGVPLLLGAGYYATATMYIVYGVFTLSGFFVWRRARRAQG